MTEAELAAMLLSARVAIVATLASLPFAIVIGYVLATFQFPGHGALNVIVHLPLVLPPVVTGYLLLLIFGRAGMVGEFLYDTFGLTLAFQWTGAALAAGIMAFPLMVRPIRLSFESEDTGLSAAAATLGANRLQRFFYVSFPLAMPGLLAATTLGFAKAMGEFGATITFAANIPGETQTLALSIFTQLQSPGGEVKALRLAFISCGLAIGALFMSEYLARRTRIWKTSQ